MSELLRRAVVCVLLGVAAASPLSAEEVSDLPKMKILGCEGICAKMVDPKPKGEHRADFPAGETSRWPDFGDGFVAIRLTVTADGHVKDPVLLKLVGPEGFGRTALEDVKTWEYEPATADGVPVERPNWYVELTYATWGGIQGARKEIYSAYGHARDFLAEGKTAEVEATLLPILAKPLLSFYERSIVSLLLSSSYALKKDYLTARDYAEDATLLDGRFLDSPARQMAFRQRIRMEAAAGHFGEALQWYEKLKNLKKGIADDDPDTKLIERVKARLAAPDPIRVPGRISTTGMLFMWQHTLVRRQFAIPEINGKLDQVQLECDQKKTISPVSTKAEWHIPKSWSGCLAIVTGDPGTTFVFVEANE